jgi:hypothetical protein
MTLLNELLGRGVLPGIFPGIMILKLYINTSKREFTKINIFSEVAHK